MYQESDQEQMAPFQTFDKRDTIKITLNPTAQKNATELSNLSSQTCQHNPHLDPYNKADQQQAPLTQTHTVQFSHYFIKHKNRDQRSKVFDAMRDLLLERGYGEISMVRDREQEQVMVVRVVERVEGMNLVVVVEDQFARDRMEIKEGFLWVGMICAVKAQWVDGKYKLDKVIDLSTPIPQIRAQLTLTPSVNRLMITKGPFRPKFSNQDSGIRLLTNQITKLKRQNIHINQLIVMGPILARNNKDVENFTLERTYEEEYDMVLAMLATEVGKCGSGIRIYVLPSLEDIVSMYPIPQPAYSPEQKNPKIKHLSNPCSLQLQTRGSPLTLDLLNYDLLKLLQSHKSGKCPPTTQLRQQLLQTYLKQPFLLNNTTSSQQPFDEINIGSLYNNGNFGELVLFSSNTSPPFVNLCGGRLVACVGALGVDYHYTGRNYIGVVSVFAGTGPAVERVKVETISLG